MKTSLILAAVLTGLLSAVPAQAAMYKWVDEQGNVIYSQLPPPDRSKAQEIAPPPPPPSKPYRPNLDGADDAQAQEGAGTGGDAEVEEAFKDELAAIRKKNCESARKNLEIYRSFNRIRGPGGEVVTLDEATRQAKIKETEAQIKENCR